MSPPAAETAPLLASTKPASASGTRRTGTALLLLSQLTISILNLITRALSSPAVTTNPLPTFQILLLRSGLTLGFTLGTLLYLRPGIAQGLQPLLIARATSSFVAVLGLYTALTALPLPDVTLISFLAPTTIALAAHADPALREPFHVSDALAALVALGGVALLAHPQFRPIAGVSPAHHVFAVGAALLAVVGITGTYLAVRRMGTRVHPLVSTAYFAGLSTFVSAVVLFSPSSSSGGWVRLEGRAQTLMTLGLGVGGFVQQWTMTRGLQLVPAASAAMLVYTQILWAVGFEWLVFGRGVDLGEALGGALVMGAAVGGAGWKRWGKRGEGEDEEERGNAS